MLFVAASVCGQDDLRPGLSSQSWDVFVQLEAESPAEKAVIFVDLLTGDTTSVTTTGARHTLVEGAVIYFDLADRKVKLVKPDGVIRDHPFIVTTGEDHSIDWAVMADGRRIAWAISRKGDGQLLTTTLSVADAAGAAIRELLVYGPREGIRLVPVAFADAGESVYVEVRADGADTGLGYNRRSGMFVLDFSGSNVSTSSLPGGGACYCAVGFGADVIARLVPEAGAAGMRLEIYELGSGEIRSVPPVSLGNYNEAGNISISPDGSWAVYALSSVTALPAERAEIKSVVVLADLESARQMVVNYPMSALVRPLSWNEDNGAILFTQEGSGGTWKMQLRDGNTVKVADGVYLGRLGGPLSA